MLTVTSPLKGLLGSAHSLQIKPYLQFSYSDCNSFASHSIRNIINGIPQELEKG